MVPPSPVDYPPPSVEMEVGFGALSRKAPGRPVNDDHYLIMRLGRHLETLKTSLPDGDLPRHFDEYGYGMVVADGMGGAGDLASRLAIATLVQLAIDFSKWHVRVNEPIADEMMDRAERYYRSVDSILQQASQQVPRGSADDHDGGLHRRQRAVLRARGPFACVSVSRRPLDAVDARPHP